MPPLISETHAARRLMLTGHAREALEAIASFDVPFASLSIVRGECHYVLGHWREAILEFETALRLSPNSPRAEILLQLSAEMLELSKTIQPAATIEQLLGVPADSTIPTFPKLSPEAQQIDEPATMDTISGEIGLVSETLADVMIRQSKFDDARKVYIQLARLNPDRYEYFRDKMKALDDRTTS